jgi:hypothetical protein
MSESNALQALQKPGGVPTVPVGGQVMVNPLAAITAGNQAAEQSFKTDQAQMQTGAMRSAMVASQAMTVARDGSDANLAASFANLRASGAFPPQLVDQEYARWKAMSPEERQDNAVRVGLVHLDQLHQVVGQTSLINKGGQMVPGTLTQPTGRGPGNLQIGQGSADITPTPGEVLGQPGQTYPASQADVDAGRASSVGQMIVVPGYEIYRRSGAPLPPGLGGGGGGNGPAVVHDSSGKAVSPANPPRLLNVPGQAPSAPPPAAPPAAPATTPNAASDAASDAASSAPSVVAPAPVGSTLPGAPVTIPQPAGPSVAPSSAFPKGAALQGGAQVASDNALMVPATGTPGAPNPLVAGDVAAIQAGMAQARGAPRPAGTQAAWNTIPLGAGSEETQSNKASADKLAADRLEATEFQSTQFPYVQALKNYGEGTKTGPTTEFWNQVAGTIRTPLAKLGMNIGPLADTTERVDALGKWLANIQSGSPISAKSDAMLAQTLKGSASTHINEVAGEDQVKAGLTLKRMKQAALNEWDSNPSVQRQYGTYLNFARQYNNTVDPRAFGVDMYNPAQIARLRAQLQSGSEEDAKRFQDTLNMARRNGMIGGAGTRAMP